MSPVGVVFVRRSGADGVGHVGWAFDGGDGTFNTGSEENPRHTLRTRPQQMGFWMIRTRDPIEPMRERAYAELKVIDLAEGDPAYAWQVVAWLSHRPYDVFGHNCLNMTYDVLRAYGVPNLPAPAHHWEPNHWFDRVAGRHYQIDADDVALEADTGGRAPTGLQLPDCDSLISGQLVGITPAIPAWRIADTPEWNELQAAISAAPMMPATAGQPQVSHYHGIMRWIRGLLGHNSVRQ
jgi:hypothetical protein